MKKKHENNVEVFGRLRSEILERVHTQIQSWGLTMPDDDPLVRHFGLNDFDRIGETEFWICNEIEEGYCGKYIFLFENQRCPSHYHKVKHETFFVVKGRVRMTAGGKDSDLQEGDVFRLPIETQHTFIAIGGPTLLLEVSKPCFYRDSFFEDPGVHVCSEEQAVER